MQWVNPDSAATEIPDAEAAEDPNNPLASEIKSSGNENGAGKSCPLSLHLSNPAKFFKLAQILKSLFGQTVLESEVVRQTGFPKNIVLNYFM